MFAQVALWTVLSLAAPAATAPLGSVVAERLRVADGDAETRQFLAADKKGRVFVLREESLTAHRLQPGDKLGLGDPIQAPTLDPEGLFLTGVAMDSEAGAWLFTEAPHQVRLFVAGKEKAVASLDYPVRALAFLAGTPLVAVEPRGLTPRVETRFPGEFPLLLEYVGSKWVPLVNRWISVEEFRENHRVSNAWARRLAIGPGDRIFCAHQVRYVVEWFSPGGKPSGRLQVGSGEIRYQPRTAEEKKELAATLPEAMAASLGDERPAYVTKAIAAGRDGRLYLLIAREEGGYALDRLDPTEEKLERLVVEGLEGTGFTLAAGSDGLYAGTIASGEGRWRLSWDSLETAKWSPVPGAKFERSSTEP
jgi:hypothetical protein